MPHSDASSELFAQAPTPENRVHVRLPLPLAGAYDYRVPDGIRIEPGDIVSVPFSGRTAIGVVWGSGGAPGQKPLAIAKLKAISKKMPVPPMTADARHFLEKVADYTASALGAVLRMALSVPQALEPARPALRYRLLGPPPGRVTPARARVLALMDDGLARGKQEIVTLADTGAGVVSGLIASGTLVAEVVPPVTPDYRLQRDGNTFAFNAAQDEAIQQLCRLYRQNSYTTTLLQGVTGAGKTDVYFELIAVALRDGRQILVLLPEIALTVSWFQRFEQRFGAPPDAWHSDLSSAERRLLWRRVAEGQARVVVGARSALFLPFTELGLVIVDEEHEAAYKQEDGVRYQARDMAVLRAALGAFPCVLVSATPSLETVVNVSRGRYGKVTLPERAGGAAMPRVEALDLRQEPPDRGFWLAPPLVTAMAETLARHKQVLLFLNRRGYAPLTLCRACGHRMQCPNCSAWLVEHRFTGRLRCHHCDYHIRLPETCPGCDEPHRLVACGPGVERIHEEVQARFPTARSLVVTSDVVYGPQAAAEVIHAIASREVDIIIGTQMVAKGHHFPDLTLVGVVDADLGLAGGDLRAAERTFQLLQQVAGRAGRGADSGVAILQTHFPDHPVMQALVSGDVEQFLQAEIQARENLSMPPFGRLVAVILSAESEADVRDAAGALLAARPTAQNTGRNIRVLGPAPAPIYQLRGRYRMRFLIHTPRSTPASSIASEWVARCKLPTRIRVAIDVDPYNFL